MKSFPKIAALSLAGTLGFGLASCKKADRLDAEVPSTEQENLGFSLPAQDQQMLSKLLAETWDCLDAMIDPDTGLPQDTQNPGGHTNTTNLGLYLASLCVAHETGLVTAEHAHARADKLLSSIEGFDRMHGFMPHIIQVKLTGNKAQGYMAVSDFNKLAVGLIMLRQTVPSLEPRITAFLDAIEWGRLYDEKSGKLSWGYDFDQDKKLGAGPLWLTADTRCAAFMMVATDAAPPEIWERMERIPLETKFGTILRGYGMGGLFLHAMDGLFLPEIDTEVGESAGNMAWQQMKLAQKRGYPLWGWSNCYMPGSGYTQGGHLPEYVVTPHVMSLMIEYYPQKVTSALRYMIENGGTVAPKEFAGKNWGLRDAYDLRTQQWDAHYLSLDQGMLFLAISNFLHDGVVRKIYASDPLVQNGLKKLEPFIKKKPELLELWAERDATELVPVPQVSAVEKMTALELSPCSNNVTQKTQGASFTLNFDNKGKEALLHAKFSCDPVNITGFKSLVFEMEAPAEPRVGHLRVFLKDKFNQERYAHIEIKPGVHSYEIPADDLHGILIDEESVTELTFLAWNNPWYYSDKKFTAGAVELELSNVRVIAR